MQDDDKGCLGSCAQVSDELMHYAISILIPYLILAQKPSSTKDEE